MQQSTFKSVFVISLYAFILKLIIKLPFPPTINRDDATILFEILFSIKLDMFYNISCSFSESRTTNNSAYPCSLKYFEINSFR